MASTASGAAAPAPPKVVASMNDLPRREFWTVVIAGFLLSMNAGYINASTMVGLFGTTVSHVTGTTTRIGVKIIQGEWDVVLRETLILFAFMFGAFVGGIILRNSKFKFTRRYGAALLTESFMLYMTAVAIYTGSYIAPMVGAFSCGLQNAVGTVYSAAILRTTHVTGTATDIGMILGQNLAIDVHHDLWKLYVLSPLLIGYFIGSLIGCALYESLDFYAFLFPATFVLIIGTTQLLLIQFRIVKYKRETKDRFEAQRRARRAAASAAAAAQQQPAQVTAKDTESTSAGAAAPAAAAPPPQLQELLDDRNRRSSRAGTPVRDSGVGVGGPARRPSDSIEMEPLNDGVNLYRGDQSREGLLGAAGGASSSSEVLAVTSSTLLDNNFSVRV